MTSPGLGIRLQRILEEVFKDRDGLVYQHRVQAGRWHPTHPAGTFCPSGSPVVPCPRWMPPHPQENKLCLSGCHSLAGPVFSPLLGQSCGSEFRKLTWGTGGVRSRSGSRSQGEGNIGFSLADRGAAHSGHPRLPSAPGFQF